MQRLFDTHRGETCVVVGNGPSLGSAPLGLLNGYPSFTSNRAYLLPGLAIRHHVVINPLVLQQNKAELLHLPASVLLFVRAGDPDFSHAYQLKSSPAPMFAYYPPAGIYEGFTVTFVSLQLAFFMGFSTALLVGVDHRYAYEGQPNEPHMLEGPDPNHFDPGYFSGQVWNNPDLRQSEESYRMAKEAWQSDGRRILNLTPGSDLDVFERVEQSKWLP